mmetsp:Transcript_89093/g.276893  ORF Transcript_89093/g.276893 Transcript_89093/m.276893 type:complete len:265 (+) Transcript_89093:631-1425(+)
MHASTMIVAKATSQYQAEQKGTRPADPLPPLARMHATVIIQMAPKPSSFLLGYCRCSPATAAGWAAAAFVNCLSVACRSSSSSFSSTPTLDAEATDSPVGLRGTVRSRSRAWPAAAFSLISPPSATGLPTTCPAAASPAPACAAPTPPAPAAAGAAENPSTGWPMTTPGSLSWNCLWLLPVTKRMHLSTGFMERRASPDAGIPRTSPTFSFRKVAIAFLKVFNTDWQSTSISKPKMSQDGADAFRVLPTSAPMRRLGPITNTRV